MGRKNKIAKFLHDAKAQVKHEKDEHKMESFKSTMKKEAIHVKLLNITFSLSLETPSSGCRFGTVFKRLLTKIPT